MTIDRLIVEFDKALRTLAAPACSSRAVPGRDLPESDLSPAERAHAAALMRVNHVGEVCAQALYQGQALTSRHAGLRSELDAAAREETEHLAWTERRIAELGGRKSLLNPAWYVGALSLGMLAGACGDRWNLGFLAETERQVGGHLEEHLSALPKSDEKSRAIVRQMLVDELSHAATAVRLGAGPLPRGLCRAMWAASRCMAGLAYRL